MTSNKRSILTGFAVIAAFAGCLVLSSCVQVNVTSGNTDNGAVGNTGTGSNTADDTRSNVHEISRVTYWFNYAEVGDGYSYELVRGEDGDTLRLTKIGYKKSEPNEFSCSHDSLAKIEDICEEHGVYSWPEKATPSEIAYADRSEKHVTVEYADGQERSFSTADELPDGGEEALSGISSVLDDMVEID